MKPFRLTVILGSVSLILLLLLSACHNSVEMDPGFIESDTIILTSGSKTLLRCDPLTWQLGYSSTKREFQAFSDDMSSYYTLTCKSLPKAEGDSITASLEWKAGDGVKKKSNLTFSVKRIADDGRIWLWNSSDGIGIVVRMLTL